MSSINITEIPPEELDVDEVAEKVVEPTKSGVDDVAGKKAEKAGFFKCFHFATAEDKTMIVFGVISAACQGACPPLNTLFMGDSVSALGQGQVGEALNKVVVRLAILGALGFMFGLIANLLLEMSAEKQVKRLKRAFLDGILRQDVGFFDTYDVGKLSSSIEQSCIKIRDGTGMKLGLIFQYTSTFITAYAIGFSKNWKLALVMSVTIPAILGIMIPAQIINGRLARQGDEEYKVAGSILEEALPAMRTVAAFGLEDNVEKKFLNQVKVSNAYDYHVVEVRSIMMTLFFFVIYSVYALGWWYGAKLFADRYEGSQGQDFSLGGVVITVFFAIVFGTFSLGQIPPNITVITQASQSIASVLEITERTSAIPITKDNKRVPVSSMELSAAQSDDLGKKAENLQGHIAFKNVQFSYPSRPNRPIYKSVSFEIQPGETVALVGPSGCGKSTIIQLLERFYDINSGYEIVCTLSLHRLTCRSIEVDGVNIQDYDVQSYRRNIALVSQEPRLFCDSIRTNIILGTESRTRHVTDEEVESAAKRANAHTFICNFPDQYDTDVGQGGNLLSGGQKQRVAIARAILRDPSILILDEATSALDNESEKIVQEALDELLETSKTTTIIVAHRLSTIRTADKVIVLSNAAQEGSEVVEVGSHDELMKIENGLYRKLVEAQQMVMTGQSNPENLQINRSMTVEGALNDLEGDVKEKVNPEELETLRKESTAMQILNATDLKPNPDVDESPSIRPSVSKGYTNKRSTLRSYMSSFILGDPVAEAESHHAISRLFKMIFSDWFYVIIGTIGAAIVGSLFPLISILMTRFIGLFYNVDPGKSPHDNAEHMRDEASANALIFVYLAIGAGISAFALTFCFGRAGEKLVYNVREMVVKKMLRQDMEFFDDRENTTGVLSAILSKDCALTRNVTGENLSLIVQNAFTLIIAMVISFSAEPRLAGVSLAAFGLMIPAIYLQITLTQPSIRPGKDSGGVTDFEAGTSAFILNETLMNLKVVAAYGLQRDIMVHADKIYEQEFRKGMLKALGVGIAGGFSTGISSESNALAFWYAGKILSQEPIPAQTLMRAIFSVSMASSSLGRSAAFANDTFTAGESMNRVFSVLDRNPAIDVSSPEGDQTTVITGEGRIRHVAFRYPTRPSAAVLNSVSFKIPAGKTTALVGASGSGKSTIIQLLERFYDVQPSDRFRLHIRDLAAEGVIFTDVEGNRIGAESMMKGKVEMEGKDIREFNLPYLRKSIALVQQEPVLFDASIAENIRYGRPEATQEEIVEAAKMANAHDFIMNLPDQYETTVGRGGGMMSGGQKQRIAIARALIRDPKLLLLDEATSALDPESERVVQETLDRLLQDPSIQRTNLIIAHRLSTIQNADNIVVFQPDPAAGSRIVEHGTHEQLMQIQDGVYRNLVEIAQGSKSPRS